MSEHKLEQSKPATRLRSLSKPLPNRGSATRERGVDRVLQILAYLHKIGRPIRPGELARGLNAPRSSTYEYIRTMESSGVLECRADGSVYFGPAVYFYGADYLREHDIVQKGRDEVDRLAHETDEMCQLCMVHNGKFVVVHMRYGSRSFNISSGIGIEIPIPWTASGRLFFSGMTDADISNSLSQEDLLLPNGRSIEIDEFIKSVRIAENQGYCITSGLVDVYTHCIAAPIHDSRGKVIATICSVVLIDTPKERIEQLRDIMVRSGHALSLHRLKNSSIKKFQEVN